MSWATNTTGLKTEFAAYCRRRHADCRRQRHRCPGNRLASRGMPGRAMKSSRWPTPAAIPRPPACWSAPRRSTSMSMPPVSPCRRDSLAEALSPRTKAVVVTHLYGKMADVAGVQQVVAGRDIAVIEDCAQAHGAMSENCRAGSLGDLGVFSFYPTKNLGTMGDGGAIVTDSARVCRARPHVAAVRLGGEIPGRASRGAQQPPGRDCTRRFCGESCRIWTPGISAAATIVARYRDAAAGSRAAVRSPARPGLCGPPLRRPPSRPRSAAKAFGGKRHRARPFTIRFPIIGRRRCAAAAGGRLTFRVTERGRQRDSDLAVLCGNDRQRDRLCVRRHTRTVLARMSSAESPPPLPPTRRARLARRRRQGDPILPDHSGIQERGEHRPADRNVAEPQRSARWDAGSGFRR